MEFFCFALPPAWKDTHPAGTDPREPVEFSFPLPRESWLWWSCMSPSLPLPVPVMALTPLW